MSTEIIDRRANGRHKSAGNQQRFTKRYREQLREAVARAIGRRSMTDNSTSVSIPRRGMGEPQFGLGSGGVRDRVLPGNKEFTTGDRLNRPQASPGGGDPSQASADGEGEDSFEFRLSREEFMDLFFEDMELPDLVKTQITRIRKTSTMRSGYSPDGVPAALSVLRTMKGSIARRIALAGPKREELRRLLERIALERDSVMRAVLERAAAELAKKIRRTPFIEEVDLRYANRVQRSRPVAQAVMVCIMDVSGSMDEERKDLAKRFFVLLHLFLRQHYEDIALVFVRHHTEASVTDEQGFFNARETGGTFVSRAYETALAEIEGKYPSSDWNIYVAQASDGDNLSVDDAVCRCLLETRLLPLVQHFTYVEVGSREPQSLWRTLESMREAGEKRMSMGRVLARGDVYPVLKDLFARKAAA